MNTFAPDTQFGKYRIIRLLGQGGMADVYEAEDTSIGRRVALKVLPESFARDKERAQRFDTEIRSSAALDHPHIVSVFEVGEIDGLHYYSMSVLPGGELKARISKGALTPDEAFQITEQIADALDYAHKKGFVHRDVKPENIIFSEDGRAILTDFGIAKASAGGSKMTATGLSIGTPHYMSPEQARGRNLDGRSDLYALGVVLYEMLTGKVPFDAQDSIAVGLSHVSDPVPVLPDGLSEFQPIIDGLMAKQPDQRFQSGKELIWEIRSLAENKSGSALSSASKPNMQSQDSAAAGKHRRGLLWAVAGGGVGLCLLAAVMFIPGILGIDGPLQKRSAAPPVGGGSGVREIRPVEDVAPRSIQQDAVPPRPSAEQQRGRQLFSSDCRIPERNLTEAQEFLRDDNLQGAVRAIIDASNANGPISDCEPSGAMLSTTLLAGAMAIKKLDEMVRLRSNLESAQSRVESELEELRNLARLAELSGNDSGVQQAQEAIAAADESLANIQKRVDLVVSRQVRLESDGRSLSRIVETFPGSRNAHLNAFRSKYANDGYFEQLGDRVEQFIRLDQSGWQNVH